MHFHVNGGFLVLLLYVFLQQCFIIVGIHLVKIRSFVRWYVQVVVLVDGIRHALIVFFWNSEGRGALNSMFWIR